METNLDPEKKSFTLQNSIGKAEAPAPASSSSSSIPPSISPKPLSSSSTGGRVEQELKVEQLTPYDKVDHDYKNFEENTKSLSTKEQTVILKDLCNRAYQLPLGSKENELLKSVEDLRDAFYGKVVSDIQTALNSGDDNELRLLRLSYEPQSEEPETLREHMNKTGSLLRKTMSRAKSSIPLLPDEWKKSERTISKNENFVKEVIAGIVNAYSKNTPYSLVHDIKQINQLIDVGQPKPSKGITHEQSILSLFNDIEISWHDQKGLDIKESSKGKEIIKNPNKLADPDDFKKAAEYLIYSLRNYDSLGPRSQAIKEICSKLDTLLPYFSNLTIPENNQKGTRLIFEGINLLKTLCRSNNSRFQNNFLLTYRAVINDPSWPKEMIKNESGDKRVASEKLFYFLNASFEVLTLEEKDQLLTWVSSWVSDPKIHEYDFNLPAVKQQMEILLNKASSYNLGAQVEKIKEKMSIETPPPILLEPIISLNALATNDLMTRIRTGQMKKSELKEAASLIAEDLNGYCNFLANGVALSEFSSKVGIPTAHLTPMADLLNQLSFYVQQQILQGDTIEERQNVLIFFNMIEKKLLNPSEGYKTNFHLLVAISSAFRSGPIFKKAIIGEKFYDQKDPAKPFDIDKIADPNKNYEVYRDELKKRPDSICLLHPLLKDITYLVDNGFSKNGQIQTDISILADSYRKVFSNDEPSQKECKTDILTQMARHPSEEELYSISSTKSNLALSNPDEI